jgi:hypothetical protein
MGSSILVTGGTYCWCFAVVELNADGKFYAGYHCVVDDKRIPRTFQVKGYSPLTRLNSLSRWGVVQAPENPCLSSEYGQNYSTKTVMPIEPNVQGQLHVPVPRIQYGIGAVLLTLTAVLFAVWTFQGKRTINCVACARPGFVIG